MQPNTIPTRRRDGAYLRVGRSLPGEHGIKGSPKFSRAGGVHASKYSISIIALWRRLNYLIYTVIFIPLFFVWS